MAARQPERTCVGCREKSGKDAMLRVVRKGEAVVVDSIGSAPGRGAYLHPSAICVRNALRGGAIARALRTSLAADGAARLGHDLERSMGAV